jgi:hypothetical protein
MPRWFAGSSPDVPALAGPHRASAVLHTPRSSRAIEPALGVIGEFFHIGRHTRTVLLRTFIAKSRAVACADLELAKHDRNPHPRGWTGNPRSNGGRPATPSRAEIRAGHEKAATKPNKRQPNSSPLADPSPIVHLIREIFWVPPDRITPRARVPGRRLIIRFTESQQCPSQSLRQILSLMISDLARSTEKYLLRAALLGRTFCFAGTPSAKGVAGIRV